MTKEFNYNNIVVRTNTDYERPAMSVARYDNNDNDNDDHYTWKMAQGPLGIMHCMIWDGACNKEELMNYLRINHPKDLLWILFHTEVFDGRFYDV